MALPGRKNREFGKDGDLWKTEAIARCALKASTDGRGRKRLRKPGKTSKQEGENGKELCKVPIYNEGKKGGERGDCRKLAVETTMDKLTSRVRRKKSYLQQSPLWRLSYHTNMKLNG